jgi:hypothetical protein
MLLAAGAGLLLWRVLPFHAWAEWGGRGWRVAASGWPLLWQAWPAVLAGTVVGVLAACRPLWWLAHRTAKADGEAAVRAEIERLQGKWGVSLARVEERTRGREEAATRREELAVQIRQAAEDAWREADAARTRAEQAALDAEEAVREARRRMDNAVAAAQRVKRKAAKSNTSALAGGPKPARNSPPEPPR